MSVINREDAIKELMSWLPKLENGLIHWTGVKAMLENLPDADDGWIPVEKALPDNSDTVLVTHRSGVYIAWYNGRYWERGASAKHREIRTVTAWRPFPPAFRPKEDK